MTNHEQTQPWYKYFWPWFIIAIPVITVAANLWFIQMSLSRGDSKVNDNYYKEGLAINQVVEADQEALAAGLTAELELDAKTGLVKVRMPAGKHLEQLAMAINHPMEASYDMVLALASKDGQIFEGRAPKPLNYSRWYVEISGLVDGKKWRLRGEWNIAQNQLTLEPSTAITVAAEEPISLEDRMAARHKVAAELTLDAAQGRVNVVLPGVDDSVDDVSLAVKHATDEGKNASTLLQRGADGHFTGTLPHSLGAGPWVLELSGTLQHHSIPWRLQGDWESGDHLSLQPRSNLK